MMRKRISSVTRVGAAIGEGAALDRRGVPDDVAQGWIELRMGTGEVLKPVSIPDRVEFESDDDVVITEFGDFECPRCKQAAPAFLLFGSRDHRDVTLVFRHFPRSDVQTTSLTTLEAYEAAGGSREFCVCELDDCREAQLRAFQLQIGEKFELPRGSRYLPDRIASHLQVPRSLKSQQDEVTSHERMEPRGSERRGRSLPALRTSRSIGE